MTLGVLALACGDDGGGGGIPKPETLEGEFVQIQGAHDVVLPLSSEDATVSCRPKPAFEEFEFEAQVPQEGGQTAVFRFVLTNYDGAGQYLLAQQTEGATPLLEVSWYGGDEYLEYLGSFDASLRVDANQELNTSCLLDLGAESQGQTTRYTGNMGCGLLWPKDATQDDVVETVHAFVDLAAKFQCEY